jgi:hypothetical protein
VRNRHTCDLLQYMMPLFLIAGLYPNQ